MKTGRGGAVETFGERAERGSVGVFVIVIATSFLIMVGLAVDVAGHLHAMQEARAVAREAARVGGQQVQMATGVRGQGARADPARAAAAAQTYLDTAGALGSATVAGPTSIRVEVTSTYPTLFLGVVGVGALTATGTAEARITRSVEGVEQ
ncbi:pilus assembly protein [Ornithinimicrobium sediminis]|uniref:pilus assembly protein n=1 Tax=Ornithinimicrobium sediminis TaxID=2904603 RepID=UPI001E34FDBA|nr:pilus assembly protein [Ornithinimicrobium sediminis]MCE0485485.1 pilus assembly protein [Ornithinimicrobium sediminis]